MYKSSKSYARIREIINTSRTMYCFMIQRRRKQLSITTYQETNEISCILHSNLLLHPIQNNLQQKFSVNGDNGGYLSIYLYSRQLWNEKYKIELSCHRYGYGHFQENCYPCPYDYAQFVLLQKNRLDEVQKCLLNEEYLRKDIVKTFTTKIVGQMDDQWSRKERRKQVD